MRIGLVFAGGFAKGAFQVGAMRALEEFIPHSDICCISAASIGAFNAYAYATNNVDGADKLWTGTVEEGSKLFITKLLRSPYLQETADSLVDYDNTLPVPLYCPLLDWRKQTVVYQDLSKADPENIKKYLRAAVSLPPYNSPLKVENVSYYDGGLVDNIPVSPLMNTSLDYIICFYFDETNYMFENSNFDNKIIKIYYDAASMLSHSFVLTQEKIKDMMEQGYVITKEKLNTFFVNGIDDLDFIYGCIKEANSLHTKPSRRLTVDVVISNLNRVTQKLTKRKDVQ